MSLLTDAKMSSLADKIYAEAVAEEVKVVKEKKVKKNGKK